MGSKRDLFFTFEDTKWEYTIFSSVTQIVTSQSGYFKSESENVYQFHSVN